MPAPTNPFKTALLKGDTLIGCWLSLANSYSAEAMGVAGFDWLLIDGEHAPNDIRSMRDQIIALDSSPSHAIVRLPIGETYMVKQVLDIGAQTILVPMVESADEARAMVSACRYPPTGVRGVGYAVTRAGKFGTIPDYGTTANDQTCVLLQVENRKGIAALDEIFASGRRGRCVCRPCRSGRRHGAYGQRDASRHPGGDLRLHRQNCRRRKSPWHPQPERRDDAKGDGCRGALCGCGR